MSGTEDAVVLARVYSNANPYVIRLGPTASAISLPLIDEDDPRLKPHHCQVCGFRYRRLEVLAGKRWAPPGLRSSS